MRGSSIFFFVTAVNLSLFTMLPLHARVARKQAGPASAATAAMVATLRLTDLCLSTEARYTRHPSMADRHSPFQEHPFALEHFPSGSMIGPPPGISEVVHESRD